MLPGWGIRLIRAVVPFGMMMVVHISIRGSGYDICIRLFACFGLFVLVGGYFKRLVNLDG